MTVIFKMTKLVIYAFTLFSGFLSTSTLGSLSLISVCLLLAAVSFCATSVWAVFGTAIKTYLQNPRLKLLVNIILSLMLVYSAAALVGLF